MNTLGSLASLYLSEKKYSEAEAAYGELIAIRKRSLGPAHSATLGAMDNLRGLYDAELVNFLMHENEVKAREVAVKTQNLLTDYLLQSRSLPGGEKSNVTLIANARL